MSFVTVFKALGPIDGRNIRRDSMLSWMFVAPLLIAVIFRWLIPWAAEAILNQFEFDELFLKGNRACGTASGSDLEGA